MIRQLIDKVVTAISTPASAADGGEDREAALRMATAVLMLDVARADDVFDESEFDRVLDLLQSHFALPAEDAAQLLNAAHEKSDDSVSAYEFTKILHDHLDQNEKARIVALLWQIAYADGRLDKYEDSLVLKVSDLLHVSRGRVMRLKHDAGSRA
ncbi:MAG: TerB family tellurite resistance protein [Woeseiaceae bacterium]